MITDLGIVVPATTWDAIFTAACNQGNIISNQAAVTEAGFQNICIWPTVDADDYIVLIRGES